MKRIYAVRDRVALEIVGLQMYALFVFRHDAQAVRYFTDSLLDDSSMMHKHPEDYELVCLGELHETMGGEVIQVDDKRYPELIITGEKITAVRSAPQIVKEA